MTLSTKILLSYLALGGGIGGIYIGVNGGIGNKVVEEVSEPVEAPNVVVPEVKGEKTEEPVEEKVKDIEVEETPKATANKESSESATSDDATQQTKITDNSEGVRQDTDLEPQTFEVVQIPAVEIQVAQAIPEIKRQTLKVETNPPTPKETKENAVVGPKEVPTSNQITPKTEEAPAGTSSSYNGGSYGMTWIVDLAKGYERQRNQVTNIIRTFRQSLS